MLPTAGGNLWLSVLTLFGIGLAHAASAADYLEDSVKTGVSFTVPIGFTGISGETSGRKFDLGSPFESSRNAASQSLVERPERLIRREVGPDGAALARIGSAGLGFCQAFFDLAR